MLLFILLALPSLFALPSTLRTRQQDTCPANSPPSCPSASGSYNSCCVERFGLIQLTQFWDAGSQTTGPSDSFTIHGTWPNTCAGEYKDQQNCDPSRYLSGSEITNLLQNRSPNTLSYMNTYWKNLGASDASLWSHEWDTHGTCLSTLEPTCFDNYVDNQEVVEYFETTVGLFKQLPTYQWLANAGIVPSTSKTYTLAQLQSAAVNNYGQEVTWGCSNGELYQVFYSLTISGNVGGDGTYYTPIAPQASSSCPRTGIRFLPKVY